MSRDTTDCNGFQKLRLQMNIKEANRIAPEGSWKYECCRKKLRPMNMRRMFFTLPCVLLAAIPLNASDMTPAANAINALGIDLLAKTKPGENALLSPYSIQSALAMTYAGADGQTREEMEKTLHYPKEEAVLDDAFAELNRQLEAVQQNSKHIVENSQKNGDGGPTHHDLHSKSPVRATWV